MSVDVSLKPLESAAQNSLMLGLFLPIQSGAWSPSMAPRGTSWTFDYNARCTVLAEQLGFDLVFGLAQWLGKGGYGGKMKFRDKSTDPLLVTAGLAALTKRIILISTVHVLYGWHPLHLAKFGATIDNMSGGRWGLNVVTGYKKSEFEMFGLKPNRPTPAKAAEVRRPARRQRAAAGGRAGRRLESSAPRRDGRPLLRSAHARIRAGRRKQRGGSRDDWREAAMTVDNFG